MYKLQYLMDLLKGNATGDTEMAERVRQLSIACSRFITTGAAGHANSSNFPHAAN